MLALQGKKRKGKKKKRRIFNTLLLKKKNKPANQNRQRCLILTTPLAWSEHETEKNTEDLIIRKKAPSETSSAVQFIFSFMVTYAPNKLWTHSYPFNIIRSTSAT